MISACASTGWQEPIPGEKAPPRLNGPFRPHSHLLWPPCRGLSAFLRGSHRRSEGLIDPNRAHDGRLAAGGDFPLMPQSADVVILCGWRRFCPRSTDAIEECLIGVIGETGSVLYGILASFSDTIATARSRTGLSTISPSTCTTPSAFSQAAMTRRAHSASSWEGANPALAGPTCRG